MYVDEHFYSLMHVDERFYSTQPLDVCRRTIDLVLPFNLSTLYGRRLVQGCLTGQYGVNTYNWLRMFWFARCQLKVQQLAACDC